MTVGQLLAATTSRELAEWEAFYKLEYEDRSVSAEELLAQKAEQKLRERKGHR